MEILYLVMCENIDYSEVRGAYSNFEAAVLRAQLLQRSGFDWGDTIKIAEWRLGNERASRFYDHNGGAL